MKMIAKILRPSIELNLFKLDKKSYPYSWNSSQGRIRDLLNDVNILQDTVYSRILKKK